MTPLSPRRSAFCPLDVRQVAPSRRRRKRGRGSEELSYARRALAALDQEGEPRGDYMVTDIRTLALGRRRRRRIVYLQQRFMGLPVYDGRRSVAFSGRLIEKTGVRVPVLSVSRLVPETTAEAAVAAAFDHVFEGSCPRIAEIASFASVERFAAFRGDGLSVATAHLSVFGAGRAHLAWVVDLAPVGERRFEIVLDGSTLGLLLRRPISQATEACLTLAPGTASARTPFEAAWETSGAVEVSFKNASWRPPAPASGVVCGTTTRDLHSLNAFTLTNRALDLLARFLAPPGPPHANVAVFTEAAPEAADAAFADARGVVLKAVMGTPSRHAVRDPSVVIHEVSHLVLDAAVGGSTLVHPFESAGESGAVSEGLADFLGLTIWNSICRSTSPVLPPEEVFGSYFLGTERQRDYSDYFAGDGPPRATDAEAHEAGKALCGALLQARAHLVDEAGLADEVADETLWTALCRGLPSLPHQGDLPKFCCVRRVVLDNVPPGLRPTVEEAFEDIAIPASCPHIA